MADKQYNNDDSSSGGSSDSDDGETNDYKYITSKKAVKIAPTQMGGVGDYDEDLDEYDSEAEMSGEEEEEEAVQDWKNLNLSEEEMQNYKQKQEELEGNLIDEDDEEEEDDDEGEENLQKFDNELRKNVITEHHPELMIHNYHEVEAMCNIVRNERGIIIDPLHRTFPFITKYERAKILGERAKQINAGAKPFIVVSDEIIDGYVIALMEFEQKKIPMIIRRPLPNNACEYWRLADLEYIL